MAHALEASNWCLSDSLISIFNEAFPGLGFVIVMWLKTGEGLPYVRTSVHLIIYIFPWYLTSREAPSSSARFHQQVLLFCIKSYWKWSKSCIAVFQVIITKEMLVIIIYISTWETRKKTRHVPEKWWHDASPAINT